MSAMIGSSLLLADEGYQISRSVRLRQSASAYFNRTPASAGSLTTWTWSAWVKRGSLGVDVGLFGARTGNATAQLFFNTSDQLRWVTTNATPTTTSEKITTRVFRDPSAWYHLLLVADTNNGTAANRIQIYVNGVRETTFSTSTDPSSGLSMQISNTVPNYVGAVQGSGGVFAYLDGYLTEINFIDGQALTPSSFGETSFVTGVWQPKKYTGTYGTNGFYLNFSDNSAATAAAIGKDYSGNGNNWTPNNISVTAGATYDSMLDVPTQWGDGGNGRGNYATLSPIDNNNGTLSSGNLNLSIPAGTSSSGFGNFAMTAGKWYWEVIPTNGSVFATFVGVSDQSAAATNRTYTTTNGWGYYSNAQTYYNNTPVSYGSTFTTNDVIGVAYDADIGSLSFYKNGVSQGVAFNTNLFGKPIIPAFFNGTSSNAQTFVANFGQRPFSYTPPTGFKALNTLNLPTPTILKGNQYFDAALWDGNSTNARVITTNVGTVDFAWVKKRNGVDDHRLANTVTGGNKHLKSNATDAESTGTTVIQAFSGSTFTLGTDNSVNVTGGTYVGWTWQEGATQGFDIVTYTGTGANRTVAHNLGVAPSFMIVKARSSAGYDWRCYHSALGATKYIDLQSTAVSALASTVWQDTAPTSSVFSVGTNGSVNANTVTFVAYLFSQIAGYSAFGSYTGNQSADGPFVFCGFRPRWIMIKSTTIVTGAWVIIDTARDTFNVSGLRLDANASSAEVDNRPILDITANGFKIRSTNNDNWNAIASQPIYIYAAFAEHPFKNALAR